MSITRRLPQTIFGRQLALNQGLGKQNSLPPGTVILNPATVTRLSAETPLYNAGLLAVGNAQAALSNHTPVKDAAIDSCRLYTGHFITVFNLGVRRGKYTAGQRAHFLLDVTSEAQPPMDSDGDTLTWAHRLLAGDPPRVLAGGAAMANPDISEVQTQTTAADTAFTTQSNLSDDLDARQEEVDDLNEDVDSLIKRVWDEVEAFYGEEEPESKRANARHWGVVYVTEGPPAVLSGLVKDGTGAPRAGATVTIPSTGATTTTNSEGRYTLNTTTLGTITLKATYGALAAATATVEIPEHTTGIDIEVPDMVIP